MAGTKEGAAKARETRIKKAGGLEQYQKMMRQRQSNGGRVPRPRAFDVDPKLASDAGRKGAINRHHKKKVQL